ncbi:hypothetical protein KJ742_01300, partial [Patescibacteria group bacterium]|nr:hypothetical protein [Patescibacteria group bacterium]MBU1682560.1 hypothetical protein [Patescibacteria group bacterium]
QSLIVTILVTGFYYIVLALVVDFFIVKLVISQISSYWSFDMKYISIIPFLIFILSILFAFQTSKEAKRILSIKNKFYWAITVLSFFILLLLLEVFPLNYVNIF